jgi:hypothetical protein
MSTQDIHILGVELDLCLQSAIIDVVYSSAFAVPAANK